MIHVDVKTQDFKIEGVGYELLIEWLAATLILLQQKGDVSPLGAARLFEEAESVYHRQEELKAKEERAETVVVVSKHEFKKIKEALNLGDVKEFFIYESDLDKLDPKYKELMSEKKMKSIKIVEGVV